jgi:hypothetical protein
VEKTTKSYAFKKLISIIFYLLFIGLQNSSVFITPYTMQNYNSVSKIATFLKQHALCYKSLFPPGVGCVCNRKSYYCPTPNIYLDNESNKGGAVEVIASLY